MLRNPDKDPRALLGFTLKRARLAAGFTSQEALAAAMGFDRSVVAKAETGERLLTAEVLTAWCAVCTTLDEEVISHMIQLVHASDVNVPLWFEEWLAAEGRASLLRYWSPVLFPPVFHLAEYTRALLVATQTDISDDTLATLTETKLNRALIFERDDPPEVLALIDELVLRRLIGSAEIMREQLAHVIELAERPNICVQIVPTAAGATAGLSGEICLATIDGGPDVLHTDAVPVGHTTDSNSVVHGAAVAFERTRGHALPRGESRIRMMEAIEIWR